MGNRSPHGMASLVEDRPVEAFEQLNVAVRIVPLRGWFLLAAAFLVLGAFGAFSFWYQVPLKVDGRGILLAKNSQGSESLLHVTAPATGRLRKVAVTVGSIVHVGDILAEIDQKELGDAVKSARAELERLREEDTRMTQLDRDEARSRAQAEEPLARALERGIELDRARLAIHRKILSGDKSLKARRLVTESDALKSQADTDEVERSVATAEARLQEIAYERVRDETTRRRASLKRQLAVREAETRLALLQERFERDTRIISPYAGKVVDLSIAPHDSVHMGTTAALLRPVEAAPSTLEAVIFVPAGLGKKIRVGDAVEIVPDTLQRQEHGFIRGDVRSISEVPCSDQSMLAELKNPSLVSSFLEIYRGQVLLTIHGALREANLAHADGSRIPLNRLEWSSSSGAYQPLSGGTLCSASIVVERRPLITLAMPWLKGLVGFD
jgi:HlyD family secretion protein